MNKFGINTLPLTERDNWKIDKILARPSISNAVHQELLLLKRLQLKSEIEGIAHSSSAYLIDIYLKHKLTQSS